MATPPGIPGIDVSAYQHGQGPIQWDQVAASGVQFAYIEATAGGSYTNSYYSADLAAAKQDGLVAGAYAFARPDAADPAAAAQADHFVDVAPPATDGMTLPPMLDVEWSDLGPTTNACWNLTAAQMVNWIATFVGRVESRTGRIPVVYTNSYWWDQCTGGSHAFATLALNTADYDNSPPRLPTGWPSYTIWQYTDGATVPGISGAVDRDVFAGNADGLARLAGRPLVTTAPTAVYHDDQTDVFATGTDGKLYQAIAANGGVFGRWSRVTGDGIISSAPAALTFATGELDVYATAPNHAVYQLRYLPGVGWGSWRSMGGNVATAPAAIYRGGLTYLYATGTDGKLYGTIVGGSGPLVPWARATPAGIISSAPTAVTFTTGELDVYATAPNHAVYQLRYLPGHGWGSWRSMGGNLATAATAIARGGLTYLYSTGTDGKLYGTIIATNGPLVPWARASPTGTVTSAPAALSLPTGELDVYATAANQLVYQMEYQPGHGWTTWSRLN